MVEIRTASQDDVEQIYELFDRRSRAALGISEVTRTGVADELRRPGVDRWVAHENGDLIGYAHLTSTQELAHAAVDAALGDELLARVLDRARARGFHHIEAIVLPEDRPFHALVGRNGFDHERDVLRMWRVLDGEIEQPVWSHGVAVRPYDAADAERVHALLDDGYRGWDSSYVPQPHDEWLQYMTDHDEFDAALWFLVERDRDLVACALHWREHQRRGWVKDIVVRPDGRGAGLGTALLLHGFRAYAARGVERVGLKVDSTNPTGALRLYERTGFELDRRYGVWSKHL